MRDINTIYLNTQKNFLMAYNNFVAMDKTRDLEIIHSKIIILLLYKIQWVENFDCFWGRDEYYLFFYCGMAVGVGTKKPNLFYDPQTIVKGGFVGNILSISLNYASINHKVIFCTSGHFFFVFLWIHFVDIRSIEWCDCWYRS